MNSSDAAKIIFVVFFALVYFGVIVYLGINFYFNTTIRKSWKIVNNFQSLKKKLKKLQVSHKTRLFLSVSFVVLNAVISIYVIASITSRGKSLSTPFLVIFGANTAIYFIYYGARKIVDIWQNTRNGENSLELQETRHSEATEESEAFLSRIARHWWWPQETPTAPSSSSLDSPENSVHLRRTFRWFGFIILFFISILAGFVASYFYLNKHQSRNMTPAESREKNQLCR